MTGGAGFIGSHLVEELAKNGAGVRVLDNFSTGKKAYLESLKKKITLIRADVTDDKAVSRAVRGVEIIFHQAATSSVEQSAKHPEETFRTNVLGTLCVFRAAVKHGVRRVVYASSSAVYGNGRALPKRETMPAAPISFYAESKRINETHARFFQNYFHLDTVGLRYFNVFGPRQDPDSPYSGVISIFLKKFKAGEPPVIYGDGGQTRDFIYVKDVVRVNLLAARRKRAAGQVFNVGSGQAVSVNELVGILNKIFGRRLSARYKKARAGDIRHSRADTRKIEKILLFYPRYPFFRALKSMVSELY